jgi:transcription antitermination factor NusG
LSIRWFVIWTAQSSEMKVADTLQAMNYDVYLPVEIRWSRHGVGRHRKPKKKIARPLMDRYVLVQIDDEIGWGEVRRVEGVERVVGRLDKIGVDALYEMKTAQALGTWDYTHEPTFDQGQPVRLTAGAGAYAGWTGRIERIDHGDKAKVELWDRIMHRWLSKPVKVSLDDLEAA